MTDNKLDCCVVRDLLPSYVENLTEEETTALVEAHLEGCPDCRRLEQDMQTQLPAEKPPARALNFLRRVKRTRLIAAILTIVVTLVCVCWLYDAEFHYPNTESGRMAAVCDYVLRESDDHLPLGTPIRVTAWETKENHLFLFFLADNNENVHGVVHLVRGINGKYRPLDAQYDPSANAGGLYGMTLTPHGTDWELFMLAGVDCREIYSATVQFLGTGAPDEKLYKAEKTYSLTGSDFMELVDLDELTHELWPEADGIRWVYADAVRLMDRDGRDITDQFRTSGVNDWGGGVGTAETFLVYVFMGITTLLGVILIRYFLRRD